MNTHKPCPVEAPSRRHLGPARVPPDMKREDERQAARRQDGEDAIFKCQGKVKYALISWPNCIVAGKPGVCLRQRLHVVAADR